MMRSGVDLKQFKARLLELNDPVVRQYKEFDHDLITPDNPTGSFIRISIVSATYGDYVGSSITRANLKYLQDKFSCFFSVHNGLYDLHEPIITIPDLDLIDNWKYPEFQARALDFLEALEGLYDYPIVTDDGYAEVCEEMKREVFDSCYWKEFRDLLEEVLPDEIGELVAGNTDKDELWGMLDAVIGEASDDFWEESGSEGFSLKLKKIQEKIGASLWHYQKKLLPLIATPEHPLPISEEDNLALQSSIHHWRENCRIAAGCWSVKDCLEHPDFGHLSGDCALCKLNLVNGGCGKCLLYMFDDGCNEGDSTWRDVSKAAHDKGELSYSQLYLLEFHVACARMLEKLKWIANCCYYKPIAL
jgi:hypothetical protein